MKIITVINAHGQASDAFKMNEKYWKQQDGDRLVICPENDPIEGAIQCGYAQHNGHESWKRFQVIIRELQTWEWDWCIMHEYDSICLNTSLPEYPGFYGNVWMNKEGAKFMAQRYANPPWTFDRGTFDMIIMRTSVYRRSVFENGEADRYWSALAMLSGVPILDYTPKGFSRGTIAEADIVDLRKSIHEGAYAIHGVKHPWVLSEIDRFVLEQTR